MSRVFKYDNHDGTPLFRLPSRHYCQVLFAEVAIYTTLRSTHKPGDVDPDPAIKKSESDPQEKPVTDLDLP